MLHLGVIGLRNIGKVHLRKAKELKDVTILAGADTDETRCAAVKEEFGLEYARTDAERIFADPRIDGVVLALPNHLHAPFAIRALQAGKHVLVEKPIAGRSGDVGAMIEARDKSGKTLMVGMNQRFTPVQYGLRNLVAANTIGEVYLAKTSWTMRHMGEGLFARGAWGFDKSAAGGGPLLDLGIHRLDLLMFLLGFPEVDAVTGFVSEGIGRREAAKSGVNYAIEDFGMGMIRLKNRGCIQLEASYYHNQSEPNKQESLISGTKGFICNNEAATMEAGEVRPVACEPVPNAPKSCVEHFCRVIRGEEELCSTCEQALMGLRIVEAIYESARSGEMVRF